MPLDLLNCAAYICCNPPEARQATEKILMDHLDCSSLQAYNVAEAMQREGIVFAPLSLMQEIAELANHPNRTHPVNMTHPNKHTKEGG